MLKNMSVLVTGAAGTLGSATAKKLLSKGCKVTLMDVRQEEGMKLAEELGSNALFCAGDVTDEKDIVKALGASKNQFGELRGVVNCAGIHRAFELYNPNREELMLDYVKDLFNVNVYGTLRVIQFAVQSMCDNAFDRNNLRGVIVNSSGFGAFDGQVGQVALSGAWGAISSMTLPLCRELGEHGIRVMAIAPGLIESDLTNIVPSKILDGLSVLTPFPKRLGYKEEFAKLVVAIMENNFLNGEVIRLDGGLRFTL